MSNRRIAGISLGLAVAAFLATALALMAAGLGLGPDLGGSSGAEPREVRLVARDMAYYLPGGTTPNPTLRFAPGERVRVVLVNEDLGLAHDVVAPGLGLATPLVLGRLTGQGRGAVASDVVRAPDRPGTHEYVCSLHPVLMRGLIEVR